MSNRNPMTDEELATALQQQYRFEFLQRQAEKQQSVLPAPSPSVPHNLQADEAEILISGGDQGFDDESYAHRLQREIDREAATTASSRTFFPSAQTRVQNVGFQSNDDAILAQQLQDEELAKSFTTRNNNYTNSHNNGRTSSANNYDIHRERQLSQEVADAEMAQRLAGYEHEAEARRVRERGTQNQCYRRIIPLLVLMIAISIPLLFVFGVFKKEDLQIGDWGPDWIDSDPWSDVGNIQVDPTGNSDITVGENAVRWATRNNQGLTLNILNAMEDKYDSMLATAVQNWDAGAPIDSLTLKLKKIDYDFECSDQNGALKICSGDYGATKWRGLNEVKLNSRTRIIISSIARINNYYLESESNAQKLYTICHELGHGFGLPHWDTDFYNTDLGNCMDYTIRPEQNMKPSESNFEYLAHLYGGRNVTATIASEANIFDDSGKEQEKENGKKKNDKKKNVRRRILHKSRREEVHYIERPEQGLIILRHYHRN